MKIMTPKFILYFLLSVALSCTSNSKRAKLSKIESTISTNIEIDDSKPQSVNKLITTNANSLKIVSWNIRDLGKSKNDQEIHQIAQIIRDYDIVAIQEVVAKDPGGAQAVAKIADELNRMGSKWDYRVSNPTKSPSAYISERYAYLWKTSKVSLMSRAYLDSELEEECLREPYIGKFQTDKDSEPFYIVNFHSRKHSDSPEEEIIYFQDYPSRLNSNRIIIAGDFNLDENHKVWDGLYQIGFKPSLKNTKTTLKIKCKNAEYLNHSIDNIYFSSSTIQMIKTGSIDIVGNCENLEKARLLSDHLPVYLQFAFN